MNDRVIPYAEGERLAHPWKVAKFGRMEGLGHSLNDPEVSGIIETWLTADNARPQ